jgi:hypothetical protein
MMMAQKKNGLSASLLGAISATRIPAPDFKVRATLKWTQ